MKKIITKFWGVALILVLLSTLFIAATPVSAADPLRWEVKTDAPSGLFSVLAPGTDVVDFDFSGAIGYACTGVSLMQTTMGGGMWSNITAKVQAAIPGIAPSRVAIAPDDANIVVTSNLTQGVAISINGGATWTPMGIPTSAVAGAIATINDVKISPAITGGIRFIVVYGTKAGNAAAIYYYNYGAGVGTWKEAFSDFGGVVPAPATQNNTYAFEFSPNFASDLMALAVTANLTGGAGDSIKLSMLSFNLLGAWNPETGYPVQVYATSAGALAVNSASLALSPDYDGSDESLRIAFVGASVIDNAATEEGGVWRCIDSAPAVQILGTATAGVAINSVAYDGTNLAAGSLDTNNVWRTDAPLGSSPTFVGARALKRIGIDDAANDLVQVMFRGETLYGAKVGAASAISKSTDYGNVWNDFTMMDSGVGFGPGTITDLYFAAAGDPWYVAAKDAATMSIYRISMFSVTRVLCVAITAPAQDIQLDGIASDGNVLYATDMEATGSSGIYYTDNGGLTRWFVRTSLPSATIADVAVESASTIYLGAAGTSTVYKSINKGFSWAAGVDCKLAGGNTIYDMKSIAEGQMVIGGTFGGVVYTTDGGTTYTAMMGTMSFQPILVTASGLATGDYVFAANTANKMVYRAVLSPANFLGEFKDMNAPAQNNGEDNYGIVYTNGILYTMSDNGTAGAFTYINRTLIPTTAAAVHTAGMWGTEFVSNIPAIMGNWTEGLKTAMSPAGTIVLYSWDFATNTIYYLDDTVALAAPALLGPAEATLVQIISPLTGAVSQVNFTWSRLSLSTNYHIQIALDENFSEVLINNIAVASTFDPVSIIYPGTPNFQPGVTYYWRVRANAPFTSPWSETRSFTTQPSAASVPVVSSPEIGGTVIAGTTPAFSWSPVAGATAYSFELSTSADFATTVYTTDTTGAGVGLPSSVTLETGTTYFWRVKSLAPVESDWSTVANFVVAEAEEAPTIPPAVTTVITIPPGETTVVTVPPDIIEEVNPAYIWAIIIIGAVLVIAVIVLIVRTRRSV